MRGRGMQAVELLDGEPERAPDDDRAVPPRADAARSTRKLRWWLAGVAALLAVVLGATQWVIRSREDASIARLAAVAGVIAEVDGPLEVGRRYSSMDARSVLGLQGGALVRGADGSLTYEWGTGSADGPSWSKQLLGPVPALAGALSVSSVSQCVPDVSPGVDASTATRVVCLITDGGTKTLDDQGSAEEVPATMTFVEVLGTGTGAPLAQWPAPRTDSFALLDDGVVLGSLDSTADVFTGRDPLTGDVRWTHGVPVADEILRADPRMRHVSVAAVGNLVIVRTSSGELQLLSAAGKVVRDGIGADGDSSWGWQVDPAGRLVLGSWNDLGTVATSIVLAPDGDPSADRSLTGSLVQAGVDDDSIPGLMLTADSALHAWDAESGSRLWSFTGVELRPGEQPYVLVVRGRVYVLTSAGLAALDGRTGEMLWRVQPEKGYEPATLMTDARHVLVGYERPAHDGDSRLVAYSFTNGAEVSHVPYPNGIEHLTAWDGTLLGYDERYDKVALLG